MKTNWLSLITKKRNNYALKEEKSLVGFAPETLNTGNVGTKCLTRVSSDMNNIVSQ